MRAFFHRCVVGICVLLVVGGVTGYVRSFFVGDACGGFWGQRLIWMQVSCGKCDCGFDTLPDKDRATTLFKHVSVSPARPVESYFRERRDVDWQCLGFAYLSGKGVWGLQDREIAFPAWLPLAVLSILPVRSLVSWRKRRRLQRDRRSGRCINCGYDLRKSTKRCPECGTEIQPDLTAVHK
jgi:hypothetical protein